VTLPRRMDDELRRQRDVSIRQLEELIRHGRQIKNTLSTDALRAWQQECAAAVNQLSGGSKAHWLARAYSEAFLVRSGNGGVVVEADTAEIVGRILDVLAQGVASLSRMDDVAAASSGEGPRPRRFDFVRNAELRPVLERAFDDSRDALDRGEFGLALILSCGIIDALLADAFHQAAGSGLAAASFQDRIVAAERAGLIRGACARLPPVARTYRELTDGDGELRPGVTVTEREARLAGQVLRVVMRDLNPGR
jgi:hypothetical protein